MNRNVFVLGAIGIVLVIVFSVFLLSDTKYNDEIRLHLSPGVTCRVEGQDVYCETIDQ